MRVPTLETDRLLVRPFTLDDLDTIHQILDVELGTTEDLGGEGASSLEERREWLRWSVLSYEQLAKLHQPPFGDRAIELRASGDLIGACGYVPCLNAFDRLPTFAGEGEKSDPDRNTVELGLYYALSPRHQRKGYATEAAQALIDYAFETLRIRRIVATTTYDNAASIAVMQRPGMRIERNPTPEPPWLQIVGILER